MSKRIFMGFIGAAAFVLSVGLASVSQAGPQSVCGDGVIEGAETCDDNNTMDGDGCSSNCIDEICGDSILENNGVAPDEECDDGNTLDGDGCQGDCTCLCGDGVVCGDEQCDDGNTIDDDDCNNMCEGGMGICGDGMVDEGEECDDGNTVDGDGCTDCMEDEETPITPTKSDQKCVNGVNKAQGGVIKTVGKIGTKCVKDLSKGKVTGSFTDCAVAGDTGKAFDKTTKANGKCSDITPNMFGWINDPTTVNMETLGSTLGAHQDLLGSSTDNIIGKDMKDEAKCQQEVQKGLVKYMDGLSKDANKAKKDCMKGKKVTPCTTSSELATAMTTDGKKGTKALSSWNTKVGKKCGSLGVETIPANFPSVCASSATYTELVACSARRARCAFCAGLNASDGLSIDCDEYASSGNPGSCDDPVTTTVGATTTSSTNTGTTVGGTTTSSSGTTTSSGGTTTSSSGTTTSTGATTTTAP